MIREIAFCAGFVLLSAPLLAEDYDGVGTAAYQDGFRDRAAWERWFAALQGDFKIGAFYWSGQRSLPHPGSCQQMNNDFYTGCTQAKIKLSPYDNRRKTEQDYKTGWNVWTPSEPNTAPSAQNVPPALAPPPVPAADGIFVMGLGGMPGSCGRWTHSPGNSEYDFAANQWALGFLTGINEAASSTSNITGGAPNSSSLDWLRLHCRSHPEHTIAKATEALLMELVSTPPSASSGAAPDIILPTLRR